MKKLSFVVVGSGFRAMFYGRIARTYPELFEMKYMLCRSQEKADRIRTQTGFSVTTSKEACEACRPDFVVVAVNKANIADVAEEWVLRGHTVLTETPAGASLEQLERIWELRERCGCRIQVAEQYFHYPSLSVGMKYIERGDIGEPFSLYISAAHDYHGASIMRKYLSVGQEAFAVAAKRFRFPLTETDSREGAVTDGRTTLRERDIALFEFASGKIGLYDFSGEQYHSFIRSRHIIVRGRDGELSDQVLYRLDDRHYPRTKILLPELEPRYRVLETKRIRDYVRMWKPELSLDEIEDEYAIACMLYDMGDYIASGKEIYPLRDALQDAYMWLVLQEAVQKPGKQMYARKMPWNAGQALFTTP